MQQEGTAVFDVLLLDRKRGERVLASGLPREDACEVARHESRRHRVGRMFLAGSERGPADDVVVIVESAAEAA